MKQKIFRFSIAVVMCLSFVSCVNPFGKGAWNPLPFRKMQKTNTSTITPADTSKSNSGEVQDGKK